MLVPLRSTWTPGEAVSIEIEGGAPVDDDLIVTRLATVVRRIPVAAGSTTVEVGELEPGGYGIRLGAARTAVDVLASPFDRPRYGFIAKLAGESEPAAVSRNFRRLHLTLALLYDWAYRHSNLLPPEDRYLDPLGQERSLAVVNGMSRALTEVGVVPLGYSAVYAIGHDEVEQWQDSVLLRTDGEPYRLGDAFLVLVDPTEPRWLAHYLDQLQSVVESTDIPGFHLDQFGWPKFARRADGTRVDLAASYVTLLHAIRERLPDAPFMFNNVNDFPTAATAVTPQDATYIEVWPPHSTLQDLALLASTARTPRPEHPPILSAYLTCFATDEASAVRAAEFVMATAYSHGATHLLLGEDAAALTSPYYPDHHELSPDALEALVPWYDFAVRYGDLLYDPAQIDVTETYMGGINEDVVVDAGAVPVSTKADAGALWTRVVRTPLGLVIHLINLADQVETEWDAGKAVSRTLDALALGIAPVGLEARVQFATVDAPDFVELAPRGFAVSEQTDALSAAQSRTTFELPPFRTWAIVLVPVEAYG